MKSITKTKTESEPKTKPKYIRLRLDIDKESHKKIKYIRDVLGIKLQHENPKIDRVGTVIKLLLFEQINLYEKDKKKFEYNWKERKEDVDNKKEMNEPRDISIRFLRETINDIDKMKIELHYPGYRNEFMYELIQEGIELFLREIEESLNVSRLNKRTIEEAHNYFSFLCKEFKIYDENFKEKGAKIGVRKYDIYRWELRLKAFDEVYQAIHR